MPDAATQYDQRERFKRSIVKLVRGLGNPVYKQVGDEGSEPALIFDANMLPVVQYPIDQSESTDSAYLIEIDDAGRQFRVIAKRSTYGSRWIVPWDFLESHSVRSSRAYVDAQSQDKRIELGQRAHRIFQEDFAIRKRPCNDVAVDANEPADRRLQALSQWIAADNDSAARYILKELQSNLPERLWRNGIILASEWTTFNTREAQQGASEALLDWAQRLRSDNDRNSFNVISCAIHRAASLILPEHIHRFEQFLLPGGMHDTRLAATQSINRILEEYTPATYSTLNGLAERIVSLGKKLLDPDVFLAGPTSAIAIEAIVATAALGAAQLSELISVAKSLHRPWLCRAIRLRLSELYASRTKRGLSTADAGVANLQAAIADLTRIPLDL
jgi:hypothetical protein